MSKAEFFNQLEKLTAEELNKVAVPVEELRGRYEIDDISDAEKALLDERIARSKADPDRKEDWRVVRERVLAKLKT